MERKIAKLRKSNETDLNLIEEKPRTTKPKYTFVPFEKRKNFPEIFNTRRIENPIRLRKEDQEYLVNDDALKLFEDDYLASN